MVLSMLKFESCIKDKVKSLKFSHSFIIWGSDEANPTAIIPQQFCFDKDNEIYQLIAI